MRANGDSLFALDLGVDRDDVVDALDALVDGAERIVDLAEVNGRVFVNNVSLGVYGEAVKRPQYRNAKLRTLLATVPDAVAPDRQGEPLRWTDPDGKQFEGQKGRVQVLVSNNRYRLGNPAESRMRPHMEEGLLGIVVVGERTTAPAHRALPRRQWRESTARSFTVEAGGRIPAGIDGEAVQLEPPLTFRTRPRALKVRIARAHPGASPSAMEPDGTWAAPGARGNRRRPDAVWPIGDVRPKIVPVCTVEISPSGGQCANATLPSVRGR